MKAERKQTFARWAFEARFMNRDLASYFGDPAFAGKYPKDYLVGNPPRGCLPEDAAL